MKLIFPAMEKGATIDQTFHQSLKKNLRKLSVLLLLLTNCTENRETTLPDTAPEARKETEQKTAYDPALDITTVAPSLYKLQGDTLNIRILEATYKPGDSSAVHAHPDFAMYVLEGGTVRINGKDGNSQVVEFKKGAGMVLPADTHSAKNIGKTTLKLVVIEVNRPRGEEAH